jgi:choline dehydrogenase
MKISLTVLALAAQAASALNIFESGDSFGIPGKNASYDYVIVGGGTGGLKIAARLAEDKNASVAVIEAGGFYQIDNGNGRSVMTNAIGASTHILNPPTVSSPVFAAVKA